MSQHEPQPEVPPSELPLRPAMPPNIYPPSPHPPSAYPPSAYPPSAYPPSAYPPSGYPPPYPYPYVVQPPVNTYAILSVVFAFVVFAPLGIYFGNKAKQQIALTGERGMELAKIGVIAGWIISCLQGAFLIVWCGLFVTFFLSAASQVP